MPFNFTELFKQKPSEPETKFRGDDAVELKHFELFTLQDILQLLKNPKLQKQMYEHERTEENLLRTAILIKAFCDGMDQEYQQFAEKKLPFKRARFELRFTRDEENDRTGFFPRKNMVYMEFNFPANIATKKEPSAINTFKLWGGEEAHHSIFSQYKKDEPEVPVLHADPVDYVLPDHEFRALQANIRQAKREKMPQKTIQQMQELLEKARLRRAIMSQKK